MPLPNTPAEPGRILALNGGSSSIRFALFRAGATLERCAHGKIERIGLQGTTLSVVDASEPVSTNCHAIPSDRRSAVNTLVDLVDTHPAFAGMDAIGHRVVHGMGHAEPAIVTSALLDELRRLTPYDPDHLPLEIELIEAFRARHPSLLQLACFDTAFHRTMPRVASQVAIPRRYEAQGVRRYGFHGLSCAYLMQELVRLGDPAATTGRVIIAHLGSGASLTAVRHGCSIDTTMGFTPASGLPMSTRAGDLDPGLISHLWRTEQMTATQFDQMVNHASGLLGISETSPDFRDLLEREGADVRAAEAVALFCYQAKKAVGALAAALAGVDTLVFAGGIGENAPVIRARICDGLAFLGIDLDPDRNASNAGLVSSDRSAVAVRVVRTDEELMIARSVAQTRPLALARNRQP
jgi:acetate kinase